MAGAKGAKGSNPGAGGIKVYDADDNFVGYGVSEREELLIFEDGAKSYFNFSTSVAVGGLIRFSNGVYPGSSGSRSNSMPSQSM